MRIYLTCITLLFACILHGQVPGSIHDPASPVINPLNPNGDGFITSTGAAFTGPSDETQFELPFIAVQQYAAEPGADNQYAAGCEFYELVNSPSSDADAGYYYYSDPDGVPENGDELIFFRFRLARFSNGSTAFSFLIDTDYRFGFDGPEADPNAVPGNPGFEKEVAVFNNTGTSGGVRVWDADGTANPTITSFQASISTNYQVSYALNQEAGCSQVPVFVDMFVPFSALGISPARQIRMVVAVNENIDSSLGGGASDIGGVDGNAIPDDDDQFIAAINSFSPIAVNDPVNKAPTALDATVMIDENSLAGTLVTAVSATDNNGDALTWSIESGNSGNTFAINPATGVIHVNNATLDYEVAPVFVLVVRVSDGKLYHYAIITIQLNDLNEPPVFQDAVVSIAENSPAGTPVHTMVGTDPDANAVLIFSITSGNAADLFTIHPGNGEISVNDNEALDFEKAVSHDLEVQVTDGSFTDVSTITIHVTDVNDRPVIRNATVTIDENTPAGVLVSNVNASDQDIGSVLQFFIKQGNFGGAFTIDKTDGSIMVNNALLLDFETNPVFNLIVTASDGALSSDAVIVINIGDVNEPPVAQDASVTIDAILHDNDILYRVSARDPDAGDMITFSFDAFNSPVKVSIDPSSGDIIISDVTPLPLTSLFFEVVVIVTDRAGLTARARIGVTIIRQPERSDIIPLRAFSPNGDDQNDFWTIRGIEAFPDNNIKVFNRWGLLVWEIDGYDNDVRVWRGDVNGQPDSAESTYFYIIKASDFEPITGYLIVKP